MDPTATGILPTKVTFEGAKGSFKAGKGTKKKKQHEKPKAFEEEVIKKIIPAKIGKGCSRKQRKMFLTRTLRSKQSQKL